MITSSSFRSVESWSPICLPKYNSRGFLYAYVSYLNSVEPSNSENSPESPMFPTSPTSPSLSKITKTDICLTLLSPNKDAFFELSNCKKKIEKVIIK